MARPCAADQTAGESNHPAQVPRSHPQSGSAPILRSRNRILRPDARRAAHPSHLRFLDRAIERRLRAGGVRSQTPAGANGGLIWPIPALHRFGRRAPRDRNHCPAVDPSPRRSLTELTPAPRPNEADCQSSTTLAHAPAATGMPTTDPHPRRAPQVSSRDLYERDGVLLRCDEGRHFRTVFDDLQAPCLKLKS